MLHKFSKKYLFPETVLELLININCISSVKLKKNFIIEKILLQDSVVSSDYKGKG